MRPRRLYLLAAVVLIAVAAYAHDFSRDTKALDVSAPIRKAATSKMNVSTIIDGRGDICVLVALDNIRLRPSPQRSVPFGTETTGTWYARFVVVPKLSIEDNMVLRASANQRFEEYKKLQEKKGVEVRGKSYFYESLADIVSDHYAYRVVVAGVNPIDDADQKEVDLFIEALASHFVTFEGKKSADLIRSRVCPPDAFR
ncbi:MAG: hypothetical protein U0894_04350 [Pirellulales bacterium]